MRRKLWTMMTGAAAALVVALPAGASPGPDDYAYSMQLTIVNSTGSTITGGAARFDANALNLVDGGYIGADGQDKLAASGTDGEAALVAQDMDGNGASWWLPISSLADGASSTVTLYTGGLTAAADNPQSFHLLDTGEKVAVAWNQAALDIKTMYTLEALGVVFGGTPSSDTDFVRRAASDATGFVYTDDDKVEFHLGLSGAAGCSSVTLSTGTLTVGAAHDIRGTYAFASGTGTAKLYVDDVEVASAVRTATTCGIAHHQTDFLIAPPNVPLSIDRLRLGAVSVTNPTYRLDLQFEPDQITETQAGSSSNSWTWQGTVDDQSSSNRDGTYTLVRDTTDITVTAGPLRVRDAYSAAAGAERYTEFIDGAASDPFGDSFAVGVYSGPLAFLGDFSGGDDQPSDNLLSSLVLLILTIPLVTAVYAATRIVLLALIAGGLAAATVILMTPMAPAWIILIVMGTAAVGVFTKGATQS